MSGVEVAGLVLGAFPIALSVLERLEGGHEEKKSRWKTIQPPENACHLRVYDFSQLENDAPPFTVASINLLSGLEAGLQGMPAQQDKTIRVYLIEDSLAGVSALGSHLIQAGFQGGFRSLQGARKTFGALASQWRGFVSEPHELQLYSFRQVELQSRIRAQSDTSGLRFIAGLIRMNMRIRVHDIQGSDNKSIAVIICQFQTNPILEPWMEANLLSAEQRHMPTSKWATSVGQLEAFSLHLKQSHTLSKKTFQALTSRMSMKQHFFLQYYRAVTKHYTLFLDAVQRDYVSARESIMDPRYSVLRPSILKEITADAYVYEEFNAIARDMTDPVEGLISVLATASTETDAWREFRASTAELQYECAEIRKTASRFSSRLDLHLKFLDVSRNMNESLRVWILSVLASAFLPLSIATGVLSMQTRFIDLNILLYDFCGVVVIVGTFLFLIFKSVRGYVIIKEKLKMTRPDSVMAIVAKNHIADKAFKATLYCIWALVLASFLTGMIKSAGLGGRIFGFGLAGFCGLFSIVFLGVGALHMAMKPKMV